MADWTRGFAAAVADIRQRVVERGWFGEAVTPRAQTITLGSAGELSPAETLGWARRDERPHGSPAAEHDREPVERAPKAPDRGIDL